MGKVVRRWGRLSLVAIAVCVSVWGMVPRRAMAEASGEGVTAAVACSDEGAEFVMTAALDGTGASVEVAAGPVVTEATATAPVASVGVAEAGEACGMAVAICEETASAGPGQALAAAELPGDAEAIPKAFVVASAEGKQAPEGAEATPTAAGQAPGETGAAPAEAAGRVPSSDVAPDDETAADWASEANAPGGTESGGALRAPSGGEAPPDASPDEAPNSSVFTHQISQDSGSGEPRAPRWQWPSYHAGYPCQDGEYPIDPDATRLLGLYEEVVQPTALSGAIVIAARDSDHVVDAVGKRFVSDVRLTMAPHDVSVDQRFALERNGDGSYRIKSLAADLVLSAASDVAKAGLAVALDRAVGTARQNWHLAFDEATSLVRILSASDPTLAICYSDANGRLFLGSADPETATYFALFHAVPTVAEGTYAITSKKDLRFVLDEADAYPVRGSNMQTWWANSSDTQFETLVWDDREGYYRIVNQMSGLVLECEGGGTANGTNVRLWTSNGSIAQRWSIIDAGSGGIDIRAAKSGLQLATARNTLAAGTNVVVVTPSSGSTHLWVLHGGEAPATGSPIDEALAAERRANTLWNGMYLPVLDQEGVSGPMVLCLSGTNLAVDPTGGATTDGTLLQLHTSNDTINQRFAVSDNGDGTYRITGLKSNLSLSLANGVIDVGLDIVLAQTAQTLRQSWMLAFDDATGRVRLISAADERYAIYVPGLVDKGAPLSLGLAIAAASFGLYRPVPTVPDGTYVVHNKEQSDLVVGSVGDAPAPDAHVALQDAGTATGLLALSWDDRVGYYRVAAGASDLVLTCKGGGTAAGTNVLLATDVGSPSQRWMIAELSGASGYDIRSAKGGLQLGVRDSTLAAGSNLELCKQSMVAARGWWLRRGAVASDDASSSAKLPVPTAWYGQEEDYQAYHPKVISFATPWRGYRYWMTYTPYPNGDSTFEDPCIVASNDLIHWVVPEGLANPLDDQHLDGTPTCYNSDAHLLYNGDEERLELFWRWKDHDDIYLYRITSTHGIVWSEKEEVMHRTGVAVDDAMSPVVIYEDGRYRMWFVADKWGSVRYCESADALHWGEERTLVIPYAASGLYSWHLDVIKTSQGYEAVIAAHQQYNNLSRMCLWYTSSADGICSWSTPELVLEPTTGTRNWDRLGLYRSSLLVEDDQYCLIYGGHASGWHCGLGLAMGATPTSLERVVDVDA